ncbi:MAG: hypothetical protein ABJI60_19595 [Kangiellaceae bacterium]
MDNNSDRHQQLNLPLDNQTRSLVDEVDQMRNCFRQLYLNFPILEVSRLIECESNMAAMIALGKVQEDIRKASPSPS